MQTITKKLNELQRPDKNVRLHGDRQIKEYMRSVEMFGQIRPLVIDENNVVLAGNGLLTALQQLGRETADCYVVSNLTSNQKKKLMLVDNKIFELGVNDSNVFDELLRDLDGDIDIPGYDEELLKVLMANAEEADEIINSYGTFSEEKRQEMNNAQPWMPQIQQAQQQYPQQKINPVAEINTEKFGDENFNCKCPRCGFKFNV